MSSEAAQEMSALNEYALRKPSFKLNGGERLKKVALPSF